VNSRPGADADTIVARATPPGRGGIAIVRLSGRDVRGIAENILGRLPAARHAGVHPFMAGDGVAIDTGIALFFPAPHSFTGEDILELHAHGGPVVCDALIERVLELGARLAGPGEFSRRAFLNDKLDLSQAEAIADLIDADSRAAARAAVRSMTGAFGRAVHRLNDDVTALRMHVEAAIDFPDEDVDFLDDGALHARLDALRGRFDILERTTRQGCLLTDGIRVVLAGRPNAGKSSLLNRLAGHDAAIVTEIPGTTRDLIRERIALDGLPVQMIDTAGLRAGAGRIEAEGVRRARDELAGADFALVIIDAATGDDPEVLIKAELAPGLPRAIVRNKIDLTGEPPGIDPDDGRVVRVSALTGAGMNALGTLLKKAAGYEAPVDGTMTARQRHLESLKKARQHFEAGRLELREHAAGELMAEELREVQNALAEITGEFTSDDLLGEIFAGFCIGK